MVRLLTAAALSVVAFLSPALAQAPQQTPDPAALQQVISVLQAQRNQALDQTAEVFVKAQTLAAENEKLKARVKELEAKAAPAEPPK